ncbi:hypothetical protein CSC76_07515 [Pseudoxanthomonas mexicana]|jgi:predicted MFS family arabinose efflux permease|uniref:hypothetical protein n=1 Tax=Pseudoxanthomonas mexicana TaxID=128785 RepID=UPI001389B539|nr:hypothetical protein [Pseudoxanthomonas mexicana]KAF1728056.1 hypothetical protein CSC76_07515 [Pseudoxanthomonas mexicana]
MEGICIIGAGSVGAAFARALPGTTLRMLPIVVQTWIFSAAPNRLESMAALFVSIAQAAIGADAVLGRQAVDQLGVTATMWFGGVLAIVTAVLIAHANHGRPVANAAFDSA